MIKNREDIFEAYVIESITKKKVARIIRMIDGYLSVHAFKGYEIKEKD